MFIVQVINNGHTWYLRSTAWASDRDRAATYATEADARAALDKARKFMKPGQFKTAQVMPA